MGDGAGVDPTVRGKDTKHTSQFHTGMKRRLVSRPAAELLGGRRGKPSPGDSKELGRAATRGQKAALPLSDSSSRLEDTCALAGRAQVTCDRCGRSPRWRGLAAQPRREALACGESHRCTSSERFLPTIQPVNGETAPGGSDATFLLTR